MKFQPDLTTETGRRWQEEIDRAKAEQAARKRAPAHRPGEMNRLESLYATYLSLQMIDGTVEGYEFERYVLILDKPDQGRAVRYKPDFRVWHTGRVTSFDEVKGPHEWEDSIIKFKWACEQFQREWFRMLKLIDGIWTVVRERKPEIQNGSV